MLPHQRSLIKADLLSCPVFGEIPLMVLCPEARLLLVQTMGGGTLAAASTLPPPPPPQLLPNITTLFIPLAAVPRGRRATFSRPPLADRDGEVFVEACFGCVTLYPKRKAGA